MDMNISVVGTSNQHLIRGWNKVFKNWKTGSNWKNSFLRSSSWFFELPILFVLAVASARVILYGNVAFSSLVISTKKRWSSFLEKVFVFQKICFKVKLLNTFKGSSYFRVKTRLTLERRAILKIPNTDFQKNPCFKTKPLRQRFFMC